MFGNKKIKAVIVAAGSGSRFGASLPKQFCLLGCRPLLMTTIERMAEAIGRENIVVVLSASMLDFWTELCEHYGFATPTVAIGGDSRSQSVANAIALFANEEPATTVMIHDGARPLATVDFLRRMSQIPEGASGVIPVVPETNSLRQVDADGSTRAVDRANYVCVQTPQTFPLSTLRAIYITPAGGVLPLSDDASAVEAAGFGAPATAPGQPTNIKITNPLDLAIAEAILKSQLKEDTEA